jgi:hypothetical protein
MKRPDATPTSQGFHLDPPVGKGCNGKHKETCPHVWLLHGNGREDYPRTYQRWWLSLYLRKTSISKKFGSIEVQLVKNAFRYFKDNIKRAKLDNTKFINTKRPPYDKSLPFERLSIFFIFIFYYLQDDITNLIMMHWHTKITQWILSHFTTKKLCVLIICGRTDQFNMLSEALVFH